MASHFRLRSNPCGNDPRQSAVRHPGAVHAHRLWPDAYGDSPWRHHRAKTEMVRARIDIALAARADHVARAVLVRAEERSAAMDLLRLARLRRVVRAVGSTRVTRDRAR